MEIVFLIAYVVLPLLAYLRVQSVGWTAIALFFSVSFFGVLVSLGNDLGHSWTKLELQWVLLAALIVVLIAAIKRGRLRLAPLRRQFLVIGLPILALLLLLFLVTVWWAPEPAYLHPVGFLISHSSAEDNAKWLDFTSQFATGNPIHQAVAMGGPLELYLTFIATAMGVVSQVYLHGYNQVAVAANTVIFGEYFFLVMAPLALAPLAEARLLSRGRAYKSRIPIPFIWLSTIVLAATILLVTAYGHMTLQFTLLVCSLWAVTFMTQIPVRRARLLTSLIVAGAMTVWLPLNVLAVVVLAGWLSILISRPLRLGRSRLDIPALVMWGVFTVALWQPIKSSLVYLIAPAASAAGTGAGGLVSTGVTVSQSVRMGIEDSGLFGSNGGTEQTQPILALLAAAGVIAAGVILAPQSVALKTSLYRRLAPIGLLAFFALAIYLLDFWSTGGGPHYGAMKFTFMASIVALVASLPFALLNLNPRSGGKMTPVRWMAIVGIVYLLVIDSFLPRSISAARPQQWKPPVPFNNPQSYWKPAEVNGTGNQPISGNPVGCVYLPQGAALPSALLVSQLSDAQRVYTCTRILAGLSGQDAQAQPVVDWLRREWLGNKGAWNDIRGYLEDMPDSVKDKQMIILDDGSNVIGLDSIRYLLERYPVQAATPAQ